MAAHSMLLPAALLLAAPLAASPLRAQGVEYALGSSSYHVSTATKGTQTSPMGNQEFDVGVEQRITVNIARQAKDTLIATLTIDSISLKSSGPTPDVSRYQGTKFTSKLSPTGRVYSTKGPEGADVLLGQLSESIARFLPTYRRALRHDRQREVDVVVRGPAQVDAARTEHEARVAPRGRQQRHRISAGRSASRRFG
jgi:hypothetical protein